MSLWQGGHDGSIRVYDTEDSFHLRHICAIPPSQIVPNTNGQRIVGHRGPILAIIEKTEQANSLDQDLIFVTGRNVLTLALRHSNHLPQTNSTSIISCYELIKI